MKISLIHPSRGRPQKAFDTAWQWIDKAGVEVEYILSIDTSDSMWIDYIMYYSGVVSVNLGADGQSIKVGNLNGIVSHRNNRSAVDAVNCAAKVSTGDVLIVMSDDFEAPENWASRIIELIGDRRDFIAKTPDGIQKWIITMPIMDRVYYNRFGYVYNPEYLHMFCDTDLTCVADLTGRKIKIDIPFKHNHYSLGKTRKDLVSDRADKTWHQGEQTFIKRYKENFGLKEINGAIESQEYLHWIKNKV